MTVHGICASHYLKVFSCGKLGALFTQFNVPSLVASPQVSGSNHLLWKVNESRVGGR